MLSIQTNRFELFNTDDDGVERNLGIVTVQLPSFEVPTNEYSGSGVGGTLNIPTIGVLNAMTVTLSFPKISKDNIRYFKLGKTTSFDLRADTTGTDPDTRGVVHIAERWSIQGPVTKCDPGKIEQKATGDASVEIQVFYAIHWIDGEQVLEWDALNTKFVVNGEDLLEETRRNIGL